MPMNIFVNLPVSDLDRSRTFFTALGFAFNETFSNDNGACIIISETASVMLLTEPFFSTFTTKAIADARTQAETIVALSVETRTAVDDMVAKAMAAGGSMANETSDQGFMYGGSFLDLDGHMWEVIYMDLDAAEE